jgi:menaquinol-cytochrome c reductase iron-sulfur subunit
MVQAVVVLGGVIGLGIAIPVLTSLVPADDVGGGANAWSPLTADEYAGLQKATNIPIKVTFDVHTVDGYLPPSDDEQFVWAIKTTEQAMEAARPDLFSGSAKLPYPVVTMGFTVFSPICPHLGCRYSWVDAQKKFICPCHGSQFSDVGTHEAGPAQRGLDPLPLKIGDNKAEITWIEYKQNTPDHIVLRIG